MTNNKTRTHPQHDLAGGELSPKFKKLDVLVSWFIIGAMNTFLEFTETLNSKKHG